MLRIPCIERPILVICFTATSLAMVGATHAKESDKEEQKPFLNKPVSPKKSIRFYKANRQLQADRITLTGGDTEAEGCQNLLKKTRVFKALQIGFSFCTLYEAKDCAVSSLVPVQSDKQKYSTHLLTEGVGWFPQGDDDRGVKLASWNCGSAPSEGEMRAEHELVRKDVKRLRREETAAMRELEKAQAAFAEAQKRLEDAKQYASRTRQEAIATGAIEPPEQDEKQNRKKTDSDSE